MLSDLFFFRITYAFSVYINSTVIERLMEDISFDAAEMKEGTIVRVYKDLVHERLSDVLVASDLSRYIL